MRALIVDDEPPACEILGTLLAEHPQVEVIGHAGTIDEARTQLARTDYDLVFLDIQLRGGSGFDLVPHVRVGARIIFVTAFDQHALRAFEVNALDYLLKPVAGDRLAVSLSRFTPPPIAGETEPRLTPPAALDLTDRVLLKLGVGSERFIQLGEIRFVSSNENYSEVAVGLTGERLLVRKTMKAWEALLPPAHFVRVHRSTIVNVSHVRELTRVSEATSHLRLDGIVDPVLVSYRHLPELRAMLPAARIA